jgi:hypothetical protein
MITNNTNPSHGIVILSGDIFYYTPFAGYFGTDIFEYTINDGFGGQSSGIITINIATPQPGSTSSSSSSSSSSSNNFSNKSNGTGSNSTTPIVIIKSPEVVTQKEEDEHNIAQKEDKNPFMDIVLDNIEILIQEGKKMISNEKETNEINTTLPGILPHT